MCQQYHGRENGEDDRRWLVDFSTHVTDADRFMVEDSLRPVVQDPISQCLL